VKGIQDPFALETYVNVDDLIDYCVASTITMTTDGLVGSSGASDHFEYFDPQTNLFNVLPWDPDNTFGSQGETPEKLIYSKLGRNVLTMIVRDRSELRAQYKMKIAEGLAVLPLATLQAKADAIYHQILGFGEYGFPESHSASFALLVYVSSWLKHHHPAAFCAALLNSQPMGFYAPAQLVQDARRHGVEVLPADVNASDWDCTLENGALRLGLRMVSGLSEGSGEKISASKPYRSVSELGLNRKELRCLAAAGALHSIAGHRRLAYWAAAGAGPRAPLDAAPAESPAPALRAPREGEDIVADYASLGLTLGRHPLALLRKRLTGFLTAESLKNKAHGSQVKVAGLVTCRQRPDTASGVIFVTLEDETGCSNIVVWSALAERQRTELLGSRLLGVRGTIERDGEVVHVIARRLSDHSALIGSLDAPARNFH